jgi:hypothetical protein
MNKEEKRKASKLYRLNNKQKITIYNKKYYLKNKEHCLMVINQWRLKNKEKIKETNRLYNLNNKSKVKEIARLYLLNNIEKRKETVRLTRLNNPHTQKAITAKRRALKLKATPRFANLKKIKEIYKNCPKGYTVDHIVPLQGKEVCGLHVEWNLQYLTPSQNSSKSNKLINDYL